jgi:hypothetical protein
LTEGHPYGIIVQDKQHFLAVEGPVGKTSRWSIVVVGLISTASGALINDIVNDSYKRVVSQKVPLIIINISNIKINIEWYLFLAVLVILSIMTLFVVASVYTLSSMKDIFMPKTKMSHLPRIIFGMTFPILWTYDTILEIKRDIIVKISKKKRKDGTGAS